MIVDRALYVEGTRKATEETDFRELREQARREAGYAWIVLADPGAEEIDELRESFDLPKLAIDDLREGHQRPKAESFEAADFLVVKTIDYDARGDRVSLTEIDAFLGTDFVILVSDRKREEVRAARRRLDEHSEIAAVGPSGAAWALLDATIDAYAPALDRLTDQLEAIEDLVFDQGSDQGEPIYRQLRQATALSRAVQPLPSVIDDIESSAGEAEAAELKPLMRDATDHARRLDEEVSLLMRSLETLLNANLSQISLAQNRVVQKVSGWAAIIAVPTLVTGIYGMNFDEMPELGWAFGYPSALGVMLVLVLVLRWYFRRVGWI